MRFLRLFLLLVVAFELSGCALYRVGPFKRYHRVRVTDIGGRLVAEWIAEGFVSKTSHGYKFWAVERLSGPPYPQLMKYPHRRFIEVGGPNIVVSRCGQPLWLYELEGR